MQPVRPRRAVCESEERMQAMFASFPLSSHWCLPGAHSEQAQTQVPGYSGG